LYPSTKPSEVELAFFAWSQELTAGVALPVPECATAISEHYAEKSSFTLHFDGGPLKFEGGKDIALSLCNTFSGMTTPNPAMMHWETCGTKVQGYFGPFSNADGFPIGEKAFLESEVRAILIDGMMEDGKFVAVDDDTCLGQCKGVKFDWEC